MKQLILRKRNILLLLIPLGIFFTRWAKDSAEVAEKVFARGIYKVLSQGLGIITGWIPFSLMELIIVLGPLTVLGLMIRQIIRVFRVKKTEENGTVGLRRFMLLMTMVQNLACLVAVVFFGYVLLCGVNYHRYPVAGQFGLTVAPSPKEELTELQIQLAVRASDLRAQLTSENKEGVYVLPFSERELGKKAQQAFSELGEEYDIFAGFYPAPKRVFFSHLMSYTGITGVFTPWTMEANVNIDISPYAIGATMCHELAHLRGFMREDEANYIAYRVCMASDSEDLQYSGVMLALIYVGNAVYDIDTEKYYEIYGMYYSEDVRRDLDANNDYWDQFEKPIVGDATMDDIMDVVNDTYLKANDQTDGMQSYGRVVDLLLAEYKQQRENTSEE